MLLLTTDPWRRLLLTTRAGYPLPKGAPAPGLNEIVLVARRRGTPTGPVHVIHAAMRVAVVRTRRFSPWRGRSGWIMRGSRWKLAQPFRLEGIQITPSDYFSGGPLVPLDPTDASEVYRRNLLISDDGVTFGGGPRRKEDREVHDLFHQLWSRSVGTPEYVKADWGRFANLLEERGVLR